VITPAVQALINGQARADALARVPFYLPAADRDGGIGLARAGGVFLHQPTAAILFPSDFPPLSRRRPGFAGLRHALVRFSFMLDRLPPRHAYQSATLLITLDHPDAVVRTQRPDWVTARSAPADSIASEFADALDALVRRGTREMSQADQEQLPVITAENRGQGGFGWHYQAREGMPLLPRVEFALAVIELPREVPELVGQLSGEAVVAAPRLGVITVARAAPAQPTVPFRLALGPAA
jgi:hypothetical protein